jgi:hypothetical protein
VRIPQVIGIIYLDRASLMPLRSINSITTIKIRMRDLAIPKKKIATHFGAILLVVMILLQLLVHHEVGTRNLADAELIGVGYLKLAELLEFVLVGIEVVVEQFLLDLRQIAIGGVEADHEEAPGDHERVIGSVALAVANAKVLPGILVVGQFVVETAHARSVV